MTSLEQPQQHRTARAILEAAASVLAENAEASLEDVARAADVGRATLYRHFPSRDALLGALRAEAVEDVARRFAAAHLDRVPVPEALERVVRAVLVVGNRYRVLMHDGREYGDDARVEELIRRPIRAVLARGAADGSVRSDVPEATLQQLFSGLLAAGVRLVSEGSESTDDATAYVTALLLDGLRAR